MDTLFERLLREKISLMIDMRVETLTVTGVSTMDAYEHQFGYLKALRDVLSAMDETTDDIRKD
jgi:hypothetical protein